MEKIDIIGQSVYCYDDKCELIKTLDLNSFTGVNFAYLNGSKLFTLNITQPIKRVVKFTELNALDSVAEFTEYPFANMTLEEQLEFDSFVQQAENLQ